MDRSLLVWLLFLGLGFPLAALVLNEVAERLQQVEHPLAGALQKVRQYVLPPLAILLLLTKVLELANAQGATRLVETVTYIAVIAAAIPLLNAVLTTGKPIVGQIKVPNLFFQVARAVVVLGIGYYILGGVWQIDLSSLATAAGVGSLVIALALQDTLSNLVSGLLLLLARPFKVGDWIDAGGTQARVTEQNWWSVTLYHSGWGYSITIPNGTLASATITNYGPGGMWKYVSAGFSYDDPPNEVVPALDSLVNGLDEIQSKGYAGINNYGDSGINYDLWYKIRPEDNWMTSNRLKAKIYYLAKRKGFTIPYPMQVQYGINVKEGLPSKIPQVIEDESETLVKFLSSLPYFFSLSQSEVAVLVSFARVQDYGLGEVIIQEGQADEGLYIARSGSVWISTKDQQGKPTDLSPIVAGEVFGEMALFVEESSPITAIAREDTQLVVIPAHAVIRLFQGSGEASGNPQFSRDFLRFIDERKKLIQGIKGINEEIPHLSHVHNGSRNGDIHTSA